MVPGVERREQTRALKNHADAFHNCRFTIDYKM